MASSQVTGLSDLNLGPITLGVQYFYGDRSIYRQVVDSAKHIGRLLVNLARMVGARPRAQFVFLQYVILLRLLGDVIRLSHFGTRIGNDRVSVAFVTCRLPLMICCVIASTSSEQ